MAYARHVKVTWDATKDLANQRKHGLSFREAAGLFTSGRSFLEVFDAQHSDVEDRFIAIGLIRRGIVLVVWTEPAEGVVRIISARWPTKREELMYRRFLEERHEG